MMTFAEKIKAARKAEGYSQRDLAERAGLHYRTIQNWESGRLPKSLDPVFRVAQVLGTTPESLLGTAEQYVVLSLRPGSVISVILWTLIVGQYASSYSLH